MAHIIWVLGPTEKLFPVIFKKYEIVIMKKQIYIKDNKKLPGQCLRDVHVEILKRNLTLL